MPIGCSSRKEKPPAPRQRDCCMLSAASTPYSGIVEATILTPYTYRTNPKNGLIYTCNGGFIDTGHLLDHIDLTYYYYQVLTKGGGNKPGTFPIFATYGKEGTVTIKSKVADADVPTLAASIAFDQSVFYEILTYWEMEALILRGGEHNSSFSPDDLVSNYTGTRIAERALKSIQSNPNTTFDNAVTAEIKTVFGLLKPCTATQTAAAFTAITNSWVGDPNARLAINNDRYTRRRNFNYLNISPCYVTTAGTGCTGTPAYPSEIPTSFPAAITVAYDVEWSLVAGSEDKVKQKIGATVKKANFATLITAMKADAATRYPDGPSECP